MKNNLNLNKKHISFYWFVPLLALIITASLIWQNSFNKGELVKLHIAEATGIEMGKTLVKFHSVPVGLVENVVLNDSLDGAVVSIRMNPNTYKLLNEDTKFWVVKPTIQTNNISGLETILSGVYIQLSKGKSSHYSSEFYAVDKAPIFSDENTEYIQLNLIGLGSKVIKNGVPINYHGFQIGAIESNNFDGKLGKVVYIAKIKKKFAYLIDTNSVFWIDNGINMTFNTNGFNFNMQNLDNLILGSISVD
ncbi:MAG: MlaD family protein, partial [Succinivibrio sp.]|nr:MlaD family protein [Succinivibrio sp.]